MEVEMSDEKPAGTTHPTPASSQSQIDALLREIERYVDQLDEVCEANLTQAEKDAGDMILGAHRSVWAGAIGMLRRFEKKSVKVSQDREALLHHRMVLSVSFLQGISLCYDAIGNGLYVQAAALLRQEMETIAALVDTRSSGEVKKITGRGQQVGKGNLSWQMNRLHGGLSSATHLTDPALLDNFYRSTARPDEGFSGRPVRLMPQYSKRDSINLWACQVGLILQLFAEIHLVLMDLYGEGANEIEGHAWESAFDALQKAGFLVEEK